MPQQNAQLGTLLQTQGGLYGYPAQWFVIDSCPLGSTAGQVLALGQFLQHYWPRYSQSFQLKRHPNLVIVSSSYHVPRVILAFGSNSPLLTADFWLRRPDLAAQLDPKSRKYALNPDPLLKKAAITVLGCDRQITATPCWQKDLCGDMEAVLNYSSNHRGNFFQASIARQVAANMVVEQQINRKRALQFRLFTVPEESPQTKENTEQQRSTALLMD